MKLRLAGLVLMVAMAAGSAAAQGCSMCASSASAADQKSQAALRRGVTVLLIPPIGLMLGFLGFSFCYRRRHFESAFSDSVGDPFVERGGSDRL